MNKYEGNLIGMPWQIRTTHLKRIIRHNRDAQFYSSFSKVNTILLHNTLLGERLERILGILWDS